MQRVQSRLVTFLASPNNSNQALALEGQDVLISFAQGSAKLFERHHKTWGALLVDSGAYSELTGAKKVNLEAYAEFAERWADRATAIAGLDDIGGDYRRSLHNYERLGFPTIHDTDPPEILPDLIAISRERGGWLGVGIKPPRQGKSDWLDRVLSAVPEDIHVHGWALRTYRKTHFRFDSFDSTNWWRDTFRLRKISDLSHLTDKELMDIVIKRYERESKELNELRTTREEATSATGNLFSTKAAGQ